jgi:hypothetical protein
MTDLFLSLSPIASVVPLLPQILDPPILPYEFANTLLQAYHIAFVLSVELL